MIVFLMLFFVYLSERVRLPAIYRASAAELMPMFGLTNALLLVTSSQFMAEAVHAIRAHEAAHARSKLLWCVGCGMAFVINKLVEYWLEIGDGVTPAKNSFFAFYFIITGLHFLHVVGGLLFVSRLRLRVAGRVGTIDFRVEAENVGLFWHFVDLLWLFIFPLIYLAGVR